MRALKIKVCGMTQPANIAAVAALPIDYMGFIFYPKSARFIDRPNTGSVGHTIKKVGVFVNETADHIAQKVAESGIDAVQLHGNESVELCANLQKQGLEVIKAFGIDENVNWSAIAPYLAVADYFLFDTKSPQHGGTGQTFDWKKLKEYPYKKPYFLSGGLSLENIQEAATFNDKRLIGLDLNSKFETAPGLKNIETLTQALKIINNE
ncbi:phosphoribosylanthranilate isomerase [Sphingobacterium sp. SGG-5]|uniref:phosphoribosylanthranilate isomerase n=1 Tax=Sphingobacterium sp. SGG-5 TaxID=2710881 RepID=UPI0013EC8071|nr:phosphoribosylanthranilate isomerase [Sphingobacterium sp. SGG-5]NGM60379.1 phosphoribosylanthranilate isomerase [Sphingobacterium sp. SGG-5]